jgi:putative ABC transport system permease protein
VLTITLQDLRFRARQFLIAIVGTSLVFSMTLLLSGLAAGFSDEIHQTIQGLGAQNWLLLPGVKGGVAALPPMPASAVSVAQGVVGVKRAAPIVVAPQVASWGNAAPQGMVMIGIEPGQLGTPQNVTGQNLTGYGQAIVDTSFGLNVGQQFDDAGYIFKVVGTVSGYTLLGGDPDVFVTLQDAQNVVFRGRPLISAVLTTGKVRDAKTPPTGYQWYSNSQLESSSLAQMRGAVASINSSRYFMWVIAVIIVAALVYVTALERTRDFAVLKALGSSSRVLFSGLAVQAISVALTAAILAMIISEFMTGLFAQPVDIPGDAFIILPVSALIVGFLSSLAALRRAVSADPAAAFA